MKPTQKAVDSAKQAQSETPGLKFNGEEMPDPMPTKVVLTNIYGFLDEEGGNNFWSEGQEVSDPDEILILVERGAPITFESILASIETNETQGE